ncbi:VP1 [Miniopterus schreibersii bat bocavirus]|uniref:Minor capsid protein VP1 n=3 Tax=Bocaparvovirus TaxID=1507401 RepID=A0A1W5PPV4_9VIRU|nr:VP1 [Miniopterus schreibersii bat bocavirus]AOX47684.1 VP1 [Miniopterus schreibersii bat bocavirus]
MAPIRRPGGWVVPGYKYLGPFNPLDNGEPVNKADRAAQKHDQAYNQYLSEGKNPYLYFNKADQDFLEDLESDRSFGGWIGKTVFGAKRAIAPSLGEPSAKQAKLDRAQKRKLYFARSNQKAKQPKMADTANNQENPEGGEAAPAGSRSGQAANAGGGGGGAGRSVGISTGGWRGGTLFSDTTVVTRVTRQWYCPIYNGHLYKAFGAQDDADSQKSYWQGISTPWGYFDFNCYAGHFSPQDWQRLTNEYRKWRPKAMHIKIYNLQIKQVVTLGADTLYNNDLTAGVHIFCDGSHQYPYPQNPWNEHVIPELPNDVWKLPQYGYYQYDKWLTSDQPNDNNGVSKALRVMAPLFMLESSSHEVLRTGEETEFNFEFDSAWVMNDRAYASPQTDYNAIVGTRRWYPTHNANTGSFTYNRYNPYKKPSNWMPGPGTRNLGLNQTTSDSSNSRGSFMTATMPTSYSITSGNNSLSHDQNIPKPSNDFRQRVTSQTQPANGACSAVDGPTLTFDVGPHNDTDGTVTSRTIDNDMTRWNTVYSANNNTITEQPIVWMYPNQAWNSTPICRGNPIWSKAPRTDRHTLYDSSDGSLVMEHPPGTIFVKTQKIPIPTTANSDTYLNLYVTGQVTCEIVWEVERYHTKNWRPEIRNTPSSDEPTAYDFDHTGAYNMPTKYYLHMPTRMGINSVL